MGMLDRSLRVLAAVVVLILYFAHQISGTTALVLLVIAVVFILTSLVSVCPLYLPFGIHTNKRQQGN